MNRSIKYTFTLLVLIFVITATAWGEDKTASQSGDWNAADTWNPSGVPADGDNITINGGIIVTCNGDLTISGRLTINSSNAALIIKGNLTCSGTIICNTESDLLVTGNLTQSAETTINSSGFIGIGGDASLGNTNINANSAITILGNLSPTGNLNMNGGSFTVLGTGSTPGMNTTIPTSDPIFSTTMGINFIYYENFDDATLLGTPTNGSLSSGNLTNTDAGDLVWTSSAISVGCNDEIKLSANITSGTVAFKYSVDGTNWTTLSPTPSGDRYVSNEITASGLLYIQITVSGLAAANASTIDEIVVQAHNSGGTATPDIVWTSGPDLEVCPTEDVTYTISNASAYSNIVWTATGGSIIEEDDATGTCTIRWTSANNALLKVEVSSSGGCNTPLYTYAIEQSSDLSVGLVSLVHCCGRDENDDPNPNGSISVTGKCGQDNNYTYSWTGPDSYTNSTAQISGLAPGTYTVTVRNDANQTASASYVVSETSLELINTKDFICNDDANDKGALEYAVSNTSSNSPSVTVKDQNNNELSNTLIQSSTIRFRSTASTANYQMKFNVGYETGMETDFSDINFSLADGTPLNFWIENYSSGNNANIWVKIPQVTTGDNELIMEWGPQTVTSQSNISKVMLQGGLNYSKYNNADFTGSVSTNNDTNPLTTPSNVTFSARWEGWIVPPADNAYYGINTNDGARVTLSSNEGSLSIDEWTYDPSDATAKFAKTAVSTFTSSNPVKVVYEMNNNDNSGVTAFIGYSTTDPTTVDNLTAIPKNNFYYRTIIATPPSDITFTKRYNQLSAGTYTVTLNDGSCTLSKTLTVATDTENPTFATFPENYFVDIATYLSGNQDVGVTAFEDGFSNLSNWTDDATANSLTISSSDLRFSGSEDFITRSFNASFYRNLKVVLTAKQNESTWTNNDFIEISVDYGDENGFQQIFIDKCVFNGASDNTGEGTSAGNTSETTTSEIALTTNLSDQKQNLKFKIRFHAEQGGVYTVSSFKIIGDEIGYFISPTTSGTPTASDDQDENPEITYTDGNPTWVCSDPTFTEGYINRTWTVTDHCGKSTTQTQMLSFGTRPTFDVPSRPDLIFDFCQNTPSITKPAATDACSGISSYTYVIKEQGQTAVVCSGNNDISGCTLPAGKDYVITWKATDGSGASVTTTQNVKIRPTITASFTYNNVLYDPNICLGQEVQVNITPTGGTGGYSYSNFSPDITGTAPQVNTVGLTSSSNKLTFRVTDQVNTADIDGGCYVDLETQEFIVHDLIETGTITRE